MSDYVAELRALVGDRELLLPSVALILSDGDGRLLLARSAERPMWMTVGGMVEPGERPEVAAVREAREEIRAEVDLGRLLGVFGGQGYQVVYANGHRAAYVVIAYEAELRSRPEPDGDEVAEVRWFERHELPALALSPLNRSLLGELGWLG